MKQSILQMLFLFVVHLSAISQGCLPEGIIFKLQEEIDNFQTNYPGCNIIEGDVEINGYGISDLSGLNMITSIEGSLRVNFCDDLFYFTGLENLTSIGGDFDVFFNDSLVNFSGLNNLSSIGGDLDVSYNGRLIHTEGLNNLNNIGGNLQLFSNDLSMGLEGLTNLAAIGGSFIVELNSGLSSFSGMANLTQIGNSIIINQNHSLVNIISLSNVTSINGDIKITDNDLLTDLTGLDNINPEMINELTISFNDLLSNCHINSICEFLESPNGPVNILNNSEGCYNVNEVAEGCGIQLPCLPFGNYFFTSQIQIDGFQEYFPECADLMGSVIIGNEGIYDLSGLMGIESIEQNLIIRNTDLLANFQGLSTISQIGGDLSIHHNYGLTDLTALSSLNAISGSIIIHENNFITNLIGLHNINANSIGNLTITGNNLLNSCAIKSICDYLAEPAGEIEVADNAEGCDSYEEIVDDCDTLAVEYNTIIDNIIISPNPLNEKGIIEYILHKDSDVRISIFNPHGSEVMIIFEGKKKSGIQSQHFDCSGLESGIYIMKLNTNAGTKTIKIVVS